MKYLTKAFLSDAPVERLVWHVCALEAILGDQQAPIQVVGRRLGMIKAETESERKKIRKQFAKVYKARSDVVHGRAPSMWLSRRTGDAARNYARKAVVWALHCIGMLVEYSPDWSTRAGREELLKLVDTDRDARERLSYLIAALPGVFPRIPK